MLALGAVVVLVVAGLGLWSASADLSPRMALTLRLVRILFPYMIFICGAAFGMGILNALGRFVEGAFMPAFLNLVWIAALGALCFFPGLETSTRVAAVCWAILAGGVAQMASSSAWRSAASPRGCRSPAWATRKPFSSGETQQ